MSKTTWFGIPQTLAPGEVGHWSRVGSMPKASIARFVFRIPGYLLKLPQGLVCLNMKVAGVDVLPPSSKPHADVLMDLGAGWMRMNVREGDEMAIDIENMSQTSVDLDVGVEYELLDVANEGRLPDDVPSDIKQLFTPENIMKAMRGYANAIDDVVSSEEGSLVKRAAGSFVARCFNVLEKRLVDDGEPLPRRSESILPLEEVTIEPGETKSVTGQPQLPFQATRWFLQVEASDGHLHADLDLVVVGFYVGQMLQTAGGGDFPVAFLMGGKELVVDVCPISRPIRIRLVNKGKVPVKVGGYVVGEVVV